LNAKICIIGAGPAGLTAAIHAAAKASQVVIVEKNTAVGRKLLLTGGGRCNLTHTGDIAEFVRRFGKSGRFLRHALHEFSPADVIQFFAEHGLETKTFPDGCIFPVTERATDVRDILLAEAKKLGVTFLFGKSVTEIVRLENKFKLQTVKETVIADKLIVATGGLSYPGTGSTGDGYRLAASLGHLIVKPYPVLVPLLTKEKWTADLAGTSLDNVTISAKTAKAKLSSSGPMIFARDGIAGPAVQDFSRTVAELINTRKPVESHIDLLPGVTAEILDKKLVSLFAENPRRSAANVLAVMLPRRLAENLFARVNVPEDTWASNVTKPQRRKLIELLKALPVTVTGTRPIAEATVTAGGIPLDQIDPKTMRSKICPGLFFAGELIDADGPCGGYNLQIAFSTGALAGNSAAKT